MRRVWKKPLWLATVIVAPFLMVEGVFLASNLLKLPQGGYVPLLIASVMMLVMWTWVRGAKILTALTRTRTFRSRMCSRAWKPARRTP